YGHDLRKLKRAFADFLENLPFYGLAVMCFDDPHVRDVAAMVSRRVISYGIDSSECDFSASNIKISADGTSYELASPEGRLPVQLKTLGRHNVLNSLAALAVAYEVNVPIAKAAAAMTDFAGVGRRLEQHGRVQIGGRQVDLIDDYGHHPTEIAATLRTVAEAWPGRRRLLVFQPHRYSRTRDTFEALAAALADADALIITEIHAAGEEPIPATTGETLAHAVRLRGSKDVVFVANPDDAPEQIGRLANDEDIVLTMGAGSIAGLARSLAAGQ
ncbi:MAG: Mur ligase family protein, partial [Betaproteobacteria bacterium]|nr:Mur ligase family protein [Betaproteobacteria bacterium]